MAKSGGGSGDWWESPFVVPREQSGLPLDRFLAAQLPEFDRAYLRSLIREGRVCVDGTPMTTSRALWGNAVVMVDPGGDDAPRWDGEPRLKARLIYEDEAVAVLDKPAGLPLHARTLARHAPGLEPARGETLHLVERMESEMSGVLPVAKTLEAARALESQRSDGTMLLEVFAIVRGTPEQDRFVIDLPLGADDRRSGRRAVDREGGDPAETRVLVGRRFDGYSEVLAYPLTHRTHQVRVHLAAAGFPPAVDALYGDRREIALSDLKRRYDPKPGRAEKPLLDRVSAHASSISLVSPAAGAVRVASPMPADLQRLAGALERHRAPREGLPPLSRTRLSP